MEREPMRGEWSKGRVVLDRILYRKVFEEDDATLRDPDRTTVSDAERGFLGRAVVATVHLDAGDTHVDVEPGVAVVTHSYDGSTLYVAPDRLPYAALFGSNLRFAFEAMAAIRDALQAGLTQERKLPNLVRGAWEKAYWLAGEVVQNQGPLSNSDYAAVIGEVDRALADPILHAMRAEPTLRWIRQILVASVLPSRSVDARVDEEIVL